MQTEILVWFVVGCVAGAVVMWLIANGRSASERGIAQERLAAREREVAALQEAAAKQEIALKEKESFCDALGKANAGLTAQVDAAKEATKQRLEDEQALKNVFSSLAADALSKNNQTFVELAKDKLGQQQRDAVNTLTEKETAIATLLKPMQESLAKLSAHSQDLEVKREGAYANVLAEILNIQKSHIDLRKETTQLVTALRAPKVRGNWGEMQLRKCFEFAGMVEHASFDVERYVKGEDQAIRPDVIVKLPNGRSIIVDAKTPLDAFLEASCCDDEVLKARHLAAHAASVRKHLDQLCGKAYWKQFPESPDFVVCFLPSEVLFSAALEQDPSLLEYSVQSKVLLVTPTTLIALLKAVAYGWEQSKIARDATLIRDEALKIQSKLAGMYKAVTALGAGLRRAGDAYDDIVARVEGPGGLFSISRRLRELKIGEQDLPVSQPISLQPRQLTNDDWQGHLSLAAATDDQDLTDLS